MHTNTRMMFYRIAPLVSCQYPSFHRTVISSARKWLLGRNPIKSTCHHPVYSNYLHYNISCQSLSTLLRSFLSFLKQPAQNSNVTTVQFDLMPHYSIQAFPSFCSSSICQKLTGAWKLVAAFNGSWSWKWAWKLQSKPWKSLLCSCIDLTLKKPVLGRCSYSIGWEPRAQRL